jgi:hypothetical protein
MKTRFQQKELGDYSFKIIVLYLKINMDLEHFRGKIRTQCT